MASRLRSGKKRGPDTDSEDDGKYSFSFMSQILTLWCNNLNNWFCYDILDSWVLYCFVSSFWETIHWKISFIRSQHVCYTIRFVKTISWSKCQKSIARWKAFGDTCLSIWAQIRPEFNWNPFDLPRARINL